MSEYHYHEIEEIIASKPGKIVHRGTLFVLITISGMLCMIFSIKYPDIITGDCIIETETPVFTLRVAKNGIIDTILYNNGEHIKHDEIIAVLNNPLHFDQYQYLKSVTNNINDLNLEDTFLASIYARRVEGKSDITLALNQLKNAIAAYKIFLNDSSKHLTIKKLQQYRLNLKKENNYIQGIIVLKKEELAISRKRLSADSVLLENVVISEKAYETTKNKFLVLREEMLRLKAQQIAYLSKEDDARRQIAILKNEIKNEKQKIHHTINEANNLLLGALTQWESENTVMAGRTGTLILDKVIHPGHNLIEGEQIGTIIPQNNSHHIAGIKLPVSGKGKICSGQKVILELDQYPAKEFGYMHGIIANISHAPVNGKYQASIILPSTLKTSYGITIPLQACLTGKAEVITNRKTIAERLLIPLKNSRLNQSK